MMYFCVRVARPFTSSTTGSQRTSLVLRPQRQVFQPYGHGYRLLRISMFT